MLKLILAAVSLVAIPSWAQIVPKDNKGTPIYGGLGLPNFSEAVTLTTSSYVSLWTIPVETALGYQRQYRAIKVRNPSTTRSVYICFGATTCATDMMKIPPGFTEVMDAYYFGPFNSITKIYGRLDSGGSVTPELTIW